MSNVLFDLCSLPVFLIILVTCHIRRIIIDRAGRVFMMMTAVSMLCCILDIGIEYVAHRVPVSATRIFLGYVISYLYLFLRNATIVMVLIYIFFVTRTEYRIKGETPKGIEKEHSSPTVEGTGGAFLTLIISGKTKC